MEEMLNSYRVKFCAVLVSLFCLAPTSLACEAGEYLVTAYYSPSPSQEYFLTGDYKSEIKLNGKGLFTASGAPVSKYKFGFIAADPCFNFGEILTIQDLGSFMVLDRGGAIKGNRIDVWFGFGESARKAAKQFGKQYKSVKFGDYVTPSTNFRNISLYYSFWDSLLHNQKVYNSEFGFTTIKDDFLVSNILYNQNHIYHKRLLKYSDHLR